MKNNIFTKSYITIVFAFLYAPILVMILFSFNSSSSTYQFSSFSYKWWLEMFTNHTSMATLKNSLLLAVFSMVIASLIGILAAIGIFISNKKRYVKSVMMVTNIPMTNPEIVTGVSMMLLFVFVGNLFKNSEVLGFWTLLIAHVTFCLPYVILNVYPKLRQFDMRLYEAAVDLGCKPIKAFFKIVLPELSSGILTGAIMSFTLSLDDFIISYFTNGPSFQTLPIYIFSLTKKRVKPDMFALSSLMFIVVLVLLIVMNIIQNKNEKKRESNV